MWGPQKNLIPFRPVFKPFFGISPKRGHHPKGPSHTGWSNCSQTSQFECKWMRLGIYVKKNIFLLLRFWVRGHYMGYVKCSNPGFSVWVSDWVHNKTLNIPAILSKKHAHISQYCNGKETEEVRRLFPTSPTTFVWIFGYLCVPTYCICKEGKSQRLLVEVEMNRREAGD